MTTLETLEALREHLSEDLLHLFTDDLIGKLYEAGYQIEITDETTYEDLAEHFEKTLADPSVELDEGVREGMKWVFGKLVKVGKAAKKSFQKKPDDLFARAAKTMPDFSGKSAKKAKSKHAPWSPMRPAHAPA
jgi:hypothetical protein